MLIWVYLNRRTDNPLDHSIRTKNHIFFSPITKVIKKFDSINLQLWRLFEDYYLSELNSNHLELKMILAQKMIFICKYNLIDCYTVSADVISMIQR